MILYRASEGFISCTEHMPTHTIISSINWNMASEHYALYELVGVWGLEDINILAGKPSNMNMSLKRLHNIIKRCIHLYIAAEKIASIPDEAYRNELLLMADDWHRRSPLINISRA